MISNIKDLIFKKIEKRSCQEIFWDQFSLTSSENSDVESFCPHDGHLPLYGFITSFKDFNIFMFVIFSPHLPHVTSTDMKMITYAKLLRIDFDFF